MSRHLNAGVEPPRGIYERFAMTILIARIDQIFLTARLTVTFELTLAVRATANDGDGSMIIEWE